MRALVTRRRRSVAIDLVVAIAEGVAVILHEGRRHGRIAEARVTAYVRRRAAANVTLGGFHAVVIALLRNLSACRRRRWWRRVIRCRLRVRASSQRNREQKDCHSKQLFHRGFLSCFF
jgi:hypothetical protein